MIGAVDAVLHDIGADEVPVELVLNKIDLVDPLGRRRLSNRFPDALQISAATGMGLEELRAQVAARFADRYEDVRLLLPYEDGAKLAEVYALGAPIHEREDSENGVLVRARLPQREVRRFARYLVADAREGSAAERGVS
jgi:GTP-binding protein HflX